MIVSAKCFWCGQPYPLETPDGVGVVGKIHGYEPCPACALVWSRGVALIELGDTTTLNRPPIARDGHMAPTGRMVVIQEEALLAGLKLSRKVKAWVKEYKRCFVDEATFAAALGDNVPTAETHEFGIYNQGGLG